MRDLIYKWLYTRLTESHAIIVEKYTRLGPGRAVHWLKFYTPDGIAASVVEEDFYHRMQLKDDLTVKYRRNRLTHRLYVEAVG